MSRIEIGRKVMWSAPVVLLVALVTAGAALGFSPVEEWVHSATPAGDGRWATLGVWMLIGIYYLFAAQCADPFWPARKRLWTKGRVWLAANDAEDPLEPFLWDRRPVPAGTDITDLVA